MASVHTQICTFVSPPKLPDGPTLPMPGPMLFRLPSTAVNEVTTSSPVASITMVSPTITPP